MIYRASITGVLVSAFLAITGLATPVIDPLTNVTIPAGKSLTLPITATSSNGRPLTYTITSSSSAFAVVMHTNNPFWQLTVAQAAATNAPGAYLTPFRGGLTSVTNVGTMIFLLFPEYAPHTVNIFQGLTYSGFYNSNTIFHRVVSGFIIQGGDPQTNGLGGLVFQYDDEFHPQAIFSGSGQLALANSGIDTDGSQFFITVAPYRPGDFIYTIFGQMVRGSTVLSYLNTTETDTNSRPLAEEIIQSAAYVTNTSDTVLTLTATNLSTNTTPPIGTITVIANDGNGGIATNTFTATAVTDTNSNHQPLFYPNNTATNLVAPVNRNLTNFLHALELDGDTLTWNPEFGNLATESNAPNSSLYLSNSAFQLLTYHVLNTNGELELIIKTITNYSGTASFYLPVSSSPDASLYWDELNTNPPNFDYEILSVTLGDTPIYALSNTITAFPGESFTNRILATFTNGAPNSVATNFSAYVNWGDDTTNAVAITANAAGEKAVLGSHTYAFPGDYPVYVQIQSGIGASSTIISTINVTNQPVPQTNLLTVQISGQGTVAPAFVNAPLVVGENYSVSATPASPWFFVNWIDNNGFILGTNANLTFTMAPGLSLTATFILSSKPTLSVVSPANGRVITNLYPAPVTITGIASNNATVTGIWCRLNSGIWQEASGTTNWTFTFVPAYGVSNVIQTYAVNNYGSISPTNTLLEKYLAGGILTVVTNGVGSISPSLNGSLLPFGTNYTLTATPAAGFTFSDWTGSFSTNKAALRFTMTNSPTVTANFAETGKPTLAIASPTAKQHLTNALPTVVGTASDIWGVAAVRYKLNSGAWTEPLTANAWTNWNVTVAVAAGSNTVSAYALSLGGNYSTTNSVSFVSSNTFQLKLSFATTKPLATNGLNFNLLVSTGLVGHIQFSTDLINWATLTNFSGTSSPLFLHDPAAVRSTDRFYRAIIP